MRKIIQTVFSVLLSITLAAGWGFALGESEKAPADLINVYGYQEDDLLWLGNAIPVSEGTMLTAASVPAGQQELILSDGAQFRESLPWIDEESGLAILLDQETTDSAFEPYDWVPSGMAWEPDGLHVLTGDEAGSRINRLVEAITSMDWDGLDARLLTLSGPVELGAAVLTETQQLAGMVIAAYAEGENRYLALTMDSISQVLMSAADELNAAHETHEPEGYVVTVTDRNLVSFDWSAMKLELAEDERAYLQVMDTANSFYTYYSLSELECPVQMLLVPGHTYVSGIVVSRGAPSGELDEYVVTRLPDAEPLTDYGFTSRVCSLALAAGGTVSPEEKPRPTDQITTADLGSGRVYFYAESSYDVETRIDGLSLLVTMKTPAGNTYSYVTGWVYDPAYEQEDIWYISLEELGFLNILKQTLYDSGTYEMAYYVGGQLGGQLTFELP